MDDLSQTEVADLYKAIVCSTGRFPALLHDENVSGLQVAMKYAFVVCGFNAANNLT
jgi:hypothetical protein